VHDHDRPRPRQTTAGGQLPRIQEHVIIASQPLDLVTETSPANARQLRIRFQQWLQMLCAAETLVDDLTLAVYEALANVVEHAYPPSHPHPMMHLKARVDHDLLLITVIDQGRWRAIREPGHRGRGLALMRSLTTKVGIHPTAEGTTVELRVALPRGRGGRAPLEPTVAA
jgi:serine/threonine-protein kinase RsbW